MIKLPWEYKHVKVLKSATDGDTFWVDLDYGNHLHHFLKVRLKGVWCFELKDEDDVKRASALKSQKYLRRLLPVGAEVYVTSKRLDQYGRLESEVIRKKDGLSINKKMLDSGNATPTKAGRLELIPVKLK